MTSFTDTTTINLLPTRLAWIRLNRLLAWALLVLPALQLACHVHTSTSMLTGLGLVVAHGALSLALFGAPRQKGGCFQLAMHVLGARQVDLSARNRFLLGGYRIVLGMTPLLVTLPFVPFYAILPFIYPIVRLPVTVLQHILDATQYALRRWHRDELLAGVVVLLYVCFSIANAIQAMFGGLQ